MMRGKLKKSVDDGKLYAVCTSGLQNEPRLMERWWLVQHVERRPGLPLVATERAGTMPEAGDALFYTGAGSWRAEVPSEVPGCGIWIGQVCTGDGSTEAARVLELDAPRPSRKVTRGAQVRWRDGGWQVERKTGWRNIPHPDWQ